ncbi:hypothetical protein DNTS_011860 [Danionella cerebrum]|uniref:RING-type E3 ubiquitin transferase n=1 Tax=Danionella cerebrum TaxID=2873325 RepID=A0A553Q7A2_9TELE|nr:hypothetical protein DNTS_011860 [Danionella translucida]
MAGRYLAMEEAQDMEIEAQMVISDSESCSGDEEAPLSLWSMLEDGLRLPVRRPLRRRQTSRSRRSRGWRFQAQLMSQEVLRVANANNDASIQPQNPLQNTANLSARLTVSQEIPLAVNANASTPLEMLLENRTSEEAHLAAVHGRPSQSLLQNSENLSEGLGVSQDLAPVGNEEEDPDPLRAAEAGAPAEERGTPSEVTLASVQHSPPGPGATADSPRAPQSDADAEGETCSICLEPWTSAGDHRLSALRCGHLFGFICISRWLSGGGDKCPQCNKPAKRAQIIFLYARRLRALDNTEEVQLKSRLEQEQGSRRRDQLEAAQCRQQLQLATDENLRLRKELEVIPDPDLLSRGALASCHLCVNGFFLQELRRWKAQAASSSSSYSTSSSQSQRQDSSGGHYSFSRAVLVSQTGGCRVLSHCDPLGCLLASQSSPQPNLMPGFGVKKISTATMKSMQYVHIHYKQIRGLAFSANQDSLLLSAALDKTIKLTSLMTNTVVQTYNAGCPVWSCCWNQDNNNYVYAGLSNGSVLVYDTRDTSTHLQELRPLKSSCPVVSLCSVPRSSSSASFPCSGIIAGTLEGGCFWEEFESGSFRPHLLPLESGNCTDLQVEPESRHCLVTYRPGRSHPSLRCVLMELNRTPPVDSMTPVCSCSPVQTFIGGTSSKLLTKNRVFKSPAGGSATLVCAGDEASNSTMVWDVGTGSLLQKLPADLPVLDICPFKINQSSFLASLTEKMIKIYSWEG